MASEITYEAILQLRDVALKGIMRSTDFIPTHDSQWSQEDYQNLLAWKAVFDTANETLAYKQGDEVRKSLRWRIEEFIRALKGRDNPIEGNIVNVIDVAARLTFILRDTFPE
jgi:hypothetical protein